MEHPIARVLPLLSPAHLDRDFDYLVPPKLDAIAQPGVRVRVRFAGRLVDGYLLERLAHTEHGGKLVELHRVVSEERVLTPEVLKLATAVAARYAGTRADVLRLAIPPRHARTESGGTKKSGGKVTTRRADSRAHEEARGVPEGRDVPSTSTVGGLGSAHSTPPNDRAEIDSPERSDTETSSEVATAPGACGEDKPSGMGAVPSRNGAAHSGRATSAEVPGAGAGVAEPSGEGRDTTSSAGVSPCFLERADAGELEVSATQGVAGEEGSETPSTGSSGAHSSADGSGTAVVGANSEESAHDDDSVNPGAAQHTFDTEPWSRYVHGGAFLSALRDGRGPRAAWQVLPGDDWALRLAELAATVAEQGRSSILVVPDQRDLDRVLANCERLVGDSVVGLAAGLGPAARYRRWLDVLRGNARVVVGTRSAVFAPARNLGLLAIWDDGDGTYAEPRAPYPHAREVGLLRAHEAGAAFVAAGFARTAEMQAVVDSGWAHDLVADRDVLRKAAPRISAPGDSDIAMERDPMARAVRIPAVAFAAARSALREGAAVLVQVPRRGYVPSLACAKCRTPARCRRCNGPLALPESRAGQLDSSMAGAQSPACRWCGVTEAAFRCATCGSRALRAMVIGAARTAEELGRAFPGVPIRGSGGGSVLDSVEPGPQVVVSTVGAEPTLRGGYGVALLLDGWALLGRADLRAAEDALRRWMSAAALVRSRGQVIVMAEPSIPTVQALVRWDPVGHASAELAARTEVGFPPAVRLAAIDGTAESVDELVSAATLPADVEVLGPVPLPAGARKPFSSEETPTEVERMLLRVPRRAGSALAQALTAAQAVRSTHRSDAPLRVQIDPVDIG